MIKKIAINPNILKIVFKIANINPKQNKSDVKMEATSKTILLIEDEETHAELVHRAFEENGSKWDIQHVGSIKEALKWLEENKSKPPSLIIADYRLPDGTGLDIAKGAKSPEEVDIPLIVLTAYGTEQLAVRSLKSGAMDYIAKSDKWWQNLPWTVERVMREWNSIMERRRAEKKLKQYVKELERANRDLEDFTSTVSHDLKTPLRYIQSYISLFIEDYADVLDETGRGYLERIKEAAERMNTLIEDLLKLSRVGRKFTKVEMVDMNKLLEEIKTELSVQIKEKGGEVVIGKLPTISTQRVWLKELFTNLIANGLKFNRSDKPKVEVNCEKREKDYLFRVRDNGIGIEEKYLQNIFKLFEKLHSQSEYEGTGAGLAICKKIVEELGGNIWVESEPGKGSTFFFTISKSNKNV